MVQGVHRDVATCTDIALYVMHAGGRIIPAVPHEEVGRMQYNLAMPEPGSMAQFLDYCYPKLPVCRAVYVVCGSLSWVTWYRP